MTLGELFAGRSVDVCAVSLRLRAVARDLGLPLGDRPRTYNTRLAQELAKWAEGQDKGDEYHRAIFRAYFVDGTNIAKMDELVDVAASLGLSRDEAARVIQRRTFREAVDVDWSRASELGITGVPTFIMRGHRAVGAQPYEVLEKFVRDCGEARRLT